MQISLVLSREMQELQGTQGNVQVQMKRLFSNQQANASSSLVRLLYITKRLTLFLLLNKIKYCRTVLKQLIFQSKKGLRGRSV